jgi:5-methylcytosine-specific restriction endonuclease McrA
VRAGLTYDFMENINVLKLDSSFKPIEVISWQEAFVLTYVGKAWAVEYTNKYVHSARETFQIPAVIALKKYIDEKFFTITCNRKNILLRDNHVCQYCQVKLPEPELTVDHVIPRSRGGTNVWENVVAACKPCNQKKGSHLLATAPVSLGRRPQKPSYRTLIKKRIGNANSKWKEYL